MSHLVYFEQLLLETDWNVWNAVCTTTGFVPLSLLAVLCTSREQKTRYVSCVKWQAMQRNVFVTTSFWEETYERITQQLCLGDETTLFRGDGLWQITVLTSWRVWTSQHQNKSKLPLCHWRVIRVLRSSKTARGHTTNCRTHFRKRRGRITWPFRKHYMKSKDSLKRWLGEKILGNWKTKLTNCLKKWVRQIRLEVFWYWERNGQYEGRNWFGEKGERRPWRAVVTARTESE